ncbi:hypothetical protein [Streptomyces lateritius]|uniref:hypothetical protein n=1 Tax=Streptomyces lateritius TaxID=67313 RepID=UPI0016770DC5|nr:hypothetical protein [Streptomyces lateritius]
MGRNSGESCRLALAREPDWEPAAFDQQRPFDLCFSDPRAKAGVLPAAGGFYDALIRSEVFQAQADDLVISIQRGLVRGFEDSCSDPLVPPGPQRGRGDLVVGVLLVGAAQHEPGQNLVGHGPSGRRGR